MANYPLLHRLQHIKNKKIMKRIVFITKITPTEENFHGPSALMFHLLKNRPKEIELIIYTLNTNKVPDKVIEQNAIALNCRIKKFVHTKTDYILNKEKVYRLKSFFTRKPILPRGSYLKLKKNILNEIKEFNPNLIWLYPHSVIGYAQQLSPNYHNIIVTGPDCASLHQSRYWRDRFAFSQDQPINLRQYEKTLNLEKTLGNIPNLFIHLVGKTDEEYFNVITGSNKGLFFPHPHYNLVERNIFDRTNERFRIVISGKLDLYTTSDFIELLSLLKTTKSSTLKEMYEFVFIGKTWQQASKELQNHGYMTTQLDWVENYISTIAQCDIQLLPISVGSGTKGKALDALSNGLLCIGSRYAFENIAIQDKKDCFIYHKTEEIIRILEDIAHDPERIKKMAETGMQNIRTYHNPKQIITSILNYVETKTFNIDSNSYYYTPLK